MLKPINSTDVWVGFKRVRTVVIEWAGIKRCQPIAFFIICPECLTKQWAKVDYLYRAADGTKNNLRCKKCGVGKPKPGDHLRRKIEPYKSFNPKNTGWCSIVNKYAISLKAHK